MMDTLITAPEAEPLSTVEAKAHLRVDVTVDDDLIDGAILNARVKAEEMLSRALITQTRELTLDRWPSRGRIVLPRLPLQSVTSVKYTDADGVEATLSSDSYVVDTVSGVLQLKRSASWPSVTLQEVAAIKVRYVAGYGDDGTDVPQPIRSAMLLWISEEYENREAGAVRNNQFMNDMLRGFYKNWPVRER